MYASDRERRDVAMAWHRYLNSNNDIKYGIIRHYLAYYRNDENPLVLGITVPLTINEVHDNKFPYNDVQEEGQMKHVTILNKPAFKEQSVAISVDRILQLCVFLEGENGCVYVSRQPNTVEKS